MRVDLVRAPSAWPNRPETGPVHADQIATASLPAPDDSPEYASPSRLRVVSVGLFGRVEQRRPGVRFAVHRGTARGAVVQARRKARSRRASRIWTCTCNRQTTGDGRDVIDEGNGPVSGTQRVPQRRGRLIRGSDGSQIIRLRLFIADRNLRRSRAAQAAVEDLVEWLHPRPCEFDIVDVLDDPQLASLHQVVVTPAVDRLAPPPTHRIAGDLPPAEQMAYELGLQVPSSRGAAPWS